MKKWIMTMTKVDLIIWAENKRNKYEVLAMYCVVVKS
jgi:hypothetical protein